MPSLAASPRIADHLRVGCSTGYMEAARGDWPALVHEAYRTSAAAVELAALTESELPGLAHYLERHPSLPFQYVSLHAPSKDRDMDEGELIRILVDLSPRVDAIVMHPDTLVDVEAWGCLGRQLVLENMDARKPAGQTADGLAEFFDVLPEARLCFDIAHAWAVDSSLGEGSEILDRFGPRLRQVHLNSLNAQQHHVPLTEEHEAIFAPLLDRCRDVPWILEAPLRHG